MTHRFLSRISALTLGCALLTACDTPPPADPEATARAIQPVAQVLLHLVKVTPGARTGEEIYNATCHTCHATGTLDSPIFGDAAAWAPRIAQGFEKMVQIGTEGINAMPAKGGAVDLTDDEFRRAVAYLANAAGADFTPPPVEEAPAEQ